jgi:hypothetical protein
MGCIVPRQKGTFDLFSPEIDGSRRSTAQLAPADMQTTIASASTLALNLNINGRASPPPVSSASLSVNPSRSKGLQLGGNKAPASTLAAQLAEEVANEAGQGSSRLWNDDLIDIHADEGDWSTSFDIEDLTRSKLICLYKVRSRAHHPLWTQRLRVQLMV